MEILELKSTITERKRKRKKNSVEFSTSEWKEEREKSLVNQKVEQ